MFMFRNIICFDVVRDIKLIPILYTQFSHGCEELVNLKHAVV